MTHHRMPMTIAILSILLLAGSCRTAAHTAAPTLYDLAAGREIAGPRVLEALMPNRLVLVGEHHMNPDHHAAQLAVIRLLADHARPAAIGLEMFRKDQQPVLDNWVAGTLDEAAFARRYLENWNFPWSLYRDIFVYARQKRIPLVGLNVPRAITRQVARQGFASLTAGQRGELTGVTCNVTREYRDFIRSALGAHGHGNMDFTHFCEAQLVWDTAMAIGAIDYLEEHPDRTMVLLAGSGHARKMGIPYQVMKRKPLRLAVLLPFTPDVFTPEKLSTTEADYIVMP